MANVKWIKITTDMFEDEKIEFITSLPEADSILIIWIRILTLAGKCNSDGYIMLTEKIAYTEEMLAHKFRKPTNVVRLALQTFQNLGMLEVTEKGLFLSNWEKHQNIEGLEKIREQNRLRKQRQREKEKQNLLENNMSRDVTEQVTQSHATDLDLELDKDIDIDKEREEDIEKTSAVVPYKKIQDLFNSTCTSFSKIRTLSAKRKKVIRDRFHQYNKYIEVFKELFEKAESSNFLKGDNERGWKADFDWLLNEDNMAKVLEGRYDKTKEIKKQISPNKKPSTKFHNFNQRTDEVTEEEFERMLLEKQKKFK